MTYIETNADNNFDIEVGRDSIEITVNGDVAISITNNSHNINFRDIAKAIKVGLGWLNGNYKVYDLRENIIE